jgi:hypothetical protein
MSVAVVAVFRTGVDNSEIRRKENTVLIQERNLFFAIVCLLAVFVILVRNAQSSARDHQIFLKTDQGPALEPLVVVASDNDHLIVAGESSAISSAWAMKIDFSGKIAWTYTLGLLAEDAEAFHGTIFSPKFTDAVAMPDGTTFLCGSMPRPPTQYAPGLLVHLDATGQVLSKQLILPKQRNASGIADINSCISWGDRLALVGRVFHVVPHKNVFDPPPRPEEYPYPTGNVYWVLLTDANGKIKSEAQIHPSTNLISLNIGPIVRLSGSNDSIVYSATDNNSTEIIRANVDGNVEAEKELSGAFSLVRPVVRDDQLQVFGVSTLAKSSALNVTMLLDNQLKETGQTQGVHPAFFLTRVAYRMPDRSLVLFGSKVSRSGAIYNSQVAHVSADLKSETDISPLRDAISDGGSIWAATPIRNPGEFAAATMAIARDVTPDKPEGTGPVPGFRAGAVLDFLQIN